MNEQLILNEINKSKELTIFYNTLNSLPAPQKRDEKLNENEKIPCILSSDNNYAYFVAITGVSILYNTHSFIEFYILSEGISDQNKALIRKAFEGVTSHFSLQFVPCDARKDFAQMMHSEWGYVTMSTCNRLLVPKLLPKLKRAVYLDVDLIALGNIKEIWHENLDGHIFGAVPLLVDRLRTLKSLRKEAIIPEDKNYPYFNSGVMLIDYDKWREKKGTNEKIIEDIYNILTDINPHVTPDELILNKFAYINGYKVLNHKYNVNPYYSFNWLQKNKKKLSPFELDTLNEYEKSIAEYGFEDMVKLDQRPIFRHFYGRNKPWLCAKDSWFALPVIEHFADFWFYAKLTPFFEDIKKLFLYEHMHEAKLIRIKEQSDTNLLHDIYHYNQIRFNYYRCKLMANITLGGGKATL